MDIVPLLSMFKGDYKKIPAGEFELLIAKALSFYGGVYRQVLQPYNGRAGRIDLVFVPNGADQSKTPYKVAIPIEIDNTTPRIKSEVKIKLFNDEIGYVILRSPFKVIRYIRGVQV